MAQIADLQVVLGNTQFSSDLYQTLNGGDENFIFSPISVHAVISMALQGAQGITAQSITTGLRLPSPQTAVEGYHSILNHLNNIENVTLSVANKVYLMEGHHLQPSFETSLKTHFQSQVELLNFAQSAAAAKSINQWVEEKTNDQIKDLVSSDCLSDLTRLVLVNAIYFKGDWAQKFDKSLTKVEPFYVNAKETIHVEMMKHLNKEFPYKHWQELNAQVLELPYLNKDLSLFIILPDEMNGIEELEKRLIQRGTLGKISQNLRTQEVNVSLPRFKIGSTIDLEDSLTKLGLGVMFDSHKANFKGMIQGQEQLYVSKVVQKAVIEVNEDGSEAAAATAMMVRATCYVPVPKFNVNHPFIFILTKIEAGSNLILFMGRITKA